jgi:hypothetical protein
MGQFIFQIPNSCPLDKRMASTVHVVGLDGIPGPGKVQFQDGRLIISRNQDESGHVFLSWPVAGFGELVLGTGTLPENGNAPDKPLQASLQPTYRLDVELARGTVNRLRNQLSLWLEGGLEVDPEVLEWSTAATLRLGQAIMCSHDVSSPAEPVGAKTTARSTASQANAAQANAAQANAAHANAAEAMANASSASEPNVPAGQVSSRMDELAPRHAHAAAAIQLATRANFRLAQNFARQVLPFRLQQTNPGSERAWTGIPVSMSALTSTGLPTAGLPASANAPAAMTHNTPGGIPLHEGQSLADFPVVRWSDWCRGGGPANYAGQSFVLGPILDAGPDGLAEELRKLENFEQRRLQVLREIKTSFTPTSLAAGLPQPAWIHAVGGLNGMGHRLMNYPQQLQFAVDILQTLEELCPSTPLSVSFDGPWGERLAWSVGGAHALQIADTLLRRGLRINLLGLDINLDYWPQGSLLRDPVQWIDLVDLWSQLGLPLVLNLRAATGVRFREEERPATVRGSCAEDQLCDLLATVVPMLLARPTVRAIIWQQTRDEDDVRFPGGGLIDNRGQLKPVGQTWQTCRRRYLDGP